MGGALVAPDSLTSRHELMWRSCHQGGLLADDRSGDTSSGTEKVPLRSHRKPT